MISFTGADAAKIEQKTISVVKLFLSTKLGEEPHLTTFAAYDAIKLLDDSNLAADPESIYSQVPRVFFSVDGHDRQPYLKTEPKSRVITFQISAEILTTEACFKAEPKLRDALSDIIDQNKKALRLRGFYEASCDPNPAKWNDQTKINPLIISGKIYIRP